MVSEELRQAVLNALQHRDLLATAEFDVSAGSNGQRSKIAELQAGRPLAIENGKRVDLAIMAYEEKTAAGGAPETFNLAHDLVKSGATSDDVSVFVNGSEVEPAAVDYAADTIDVATNADDTVGIFYASGKQARIEVQKTAPNGTHEVLWTGDVSLLHARNHEKEPVTFQLNQSFLQSVIPTDWKLELYIDAPYVARFEKDIDGDGNAEKASNALVSVPIFGGTGEVNGLGKATRTDTAAR